ncbi:hypothetical protein BFP72_09145 [Reichenbachiella sp. 5M10]|uniref:hypothetical protein n=1 Tax=Reichenbachiella sp. 5M10 TaxID=1889772 RepID=UPI000C1501B4|nr:hypothetical protein [Reichenbachiella sp. 5M10]PIB35544.1 hypothetical protein BFP72_09145 [Reichenbachiella sp. 5M10]
MNIVKVLTVLYWVLFAVTIWTFYVSLRSETLELEYALIALGTWVAAFGVKWYIKRIKNH